MRFVASRKPTMLISLLLVVVAAAVGGVVLATSSKAGGVNLTSSKLVPADAAAYVGLNTDLSSSQWVAAFDLAKRLGEQDPRQAMKDAAESGGEVNWEDDVAPFLGGDASIWATGDLWGAVSSGSNSFSGGAIFKCNDARKAFEAIKNRSQSPFSSASYDGVDYIASDDGGGFAAVIGQHLVVTWDEAALKAVIDVAHARQPSLGDSAAFKQLKDDLTGNFLGFEYVDLKKMLDKRFIDDPAVQKILEQAGGQNAALRPIAGAITANKAGFAVQVAARADAAVNPGALPRTSRFVKVAPANTLLFASTAGIAQAWNEAMSEESRAQLDDQLTGQGVPLTLNDILGGAAEELGVRSLDDIFGLLDGETAVAVWNSADGGLEGLLMAEVTDDARTKAVLLKLVDPANPPRSEAVNGREMVIVTTGNGTNAAYSIDGGELFIGTEAGVRAALSGKGEHLSGTRAYTHTVEALSTPLGSYLFVNLQEALNSSLPERALAVPVASEALEGTILNFVNQNGLLRVSGVVSVRD